MWKLQRYYLREVSSNALLTVGVLFGIVLVSLIYKGIAYAEGFGLAAAAQITFYWTADALPHLLPVAMMFAIVLAYARAAQDREITAIRAAGISPRVAMAPALLIGIAFSLVSCFALHYLVPAAHFRKYRVVADNIVAAMETIGLTSGDRLAYEGLQVKWEGETEDGRWKDVVIRVRTGDGAVGEAVDRYEVLLADEAFVQVRDEHLVLVLRGVQKDVGNVIVGKEEVRVSVNLREISEKERRNEGNRDVRSDQLLAEVYRGVHQDPGAARFTVHRRACFGLLPALLAPIGFCIGVFSSRRGRVLALVLGLLPVFTFLLADVATKRLARSIDWPPIAWLPAGVLVVLGIPICWRLLRV